jgi:hypothetical protein
MPEPIPIFSRSKRRPPSGMADHHRTPQVVIHRDTDDDWKRITLIDDYGGRISLSVEQLRSLATAVLSDEFTLMTGR